MKHLSEKPSIRLQQQHVVSQQTNHCIVITNMATVYLQGGADVSVGWLFA